MKLRELTLAFMITCGLISCEMGGLNIEINNLREEKVSEIKIKYLGNIENIYDISPKTKKYFNYKIKKDGGVSIIFEGKEYNGAYISHGITTNCVFYIAVGDSKLDCRH